MASSRSTRRRRWRSFRCSNCRCRTSAPMRTASVVAPSTRQPWNPVDVDEHARPDVAVGQFQQQALPAGEDDGSRFGQGVHGLVDELGRTYPNAGGFIPDAPDCCAGQHIARRPRKRCIMKANLRTERRSPCVPSSYLGMSMPRREDDRLLRGNRLGVAEIAVPGHGGASLSCAARSHTAGSSGRRERRARGARGGRRVDGRGPGPARTCRRSAARTTHEAVAAAGHRPGALPRGAGRGRRRPRPLCRRGRLRRGRRRHRRRCQRSSTRARRCPATRCSCGTTGNLRRREDGRRSGRRRTGRRARRGGGDVPTGAGTAPVSGVPRHRGTAGRRRRHHRLGLAPGAAHRARRAGRRFRARRATGPGGGARRRRGLRRQDRHLVGVPRGHPARAGTGPAGALAGGPT